MIIQQFRVLAITILLFLCACNSRQQLPLVPKPKLKPTPTQPSTIKVEVITGGPAVITTSKAEFQVRSNGYLQASLLKDGRKLSLDEPRVGALSDSDYAVVDGKEVHFTLDFQQTQVLESFGKLGVGKRLEIPARPLGPSGIELQRVLVIEAYDKFPNTLLTSVEYRNSGSKSVRIEKIMDQRHRFNAKLSNGQMQSWDLWSYHRAGGKSESIRLTRNFSRRNTLGKVTESEEKALPLAAFWTSDVGEAVGELDAIAIDTAIPVSVGSDGRVAVQLESVPNGALLAGETFAGPRNFLCVYEGDAAEPEHLLTALPPREISEMPKHEAAAR